MKNAEKYGFSPENDGITNARALQSALIGGGEIIVSRPGEYLIADQILLDDDTTLVFLPGVFIKRELINGGNGYAFVNRGAYTKSYNKNIRIKGLHLICNGVVSSPTSGKTILGLRGQLSFFYIRNLEITDFECLDLPSSNFCIHICTFNNVSVERVRIEGKKDAVHFGRGTGFAVRHGKFKTYDDPIALNAHDYVSSNPELGWIENGIVEDCYDLEDDSTVGFFCRILAGSWREWYAGMEVQRSDTVVSDGKLYRVSMPADGKNYVSHNRPIHNSGTEIYDGIAWAFVQEGDILNAGCKNILFKDIHLQKTRPTAFSFHFDKDNYSRSYYPESDTPVQDNIRFENVYLESNNVKRFISAVTPITNVSFSNCDIKGSVISLKSIGTEGIIYHITNMYFSKTRCNGKLEDAICTTEEIKISINIV